MSKKLTSGYKFGPRIISYQEMWNKNTMNFMQPVHDIFSAYIPRDKYNILFTWHFLFQYIVPGQELVHMSNEWPMVGHKIIKIAYQLVSKNWFVVDQANNTNSNPLSGRTMPQEPAPSSNVGTRSLTQPCSRGAAAMFAYGGRPGDTMRRAGLAASTTI